MRTLLSLCLLLAVSGNAAADPNVETWSDLHQIRTGPAWWRVKLLMDRYGVPRKESEPLASVIVPLRQRMDLRMFTLGRVIIQEAEEETLGLGDLAD